MCGWSVVYKGYFSSLTKKYIKYEAILFVDEGYSTPFPSNGAKYDYSALSKWLSQISMCVYLFWLWLDLF